MTQKKTKLPLSKTHPKLAKEAHGWDPAEFSAGMDRKVNWKCSLGHTWNASIFRRCRQDLGCPVCSRRKIIAGVNDFATTHPELAMQVIEGDPTKMAAGSVKKLGWECSKGHRWSTTVLSRTRNKTGCPYCAGKKILPGFNDLKTLFPDLSGQAYNWDPSSVSPNSHKKLEWICKEKHTWKTSPNSRITSNKRSSSINSNGCPYCWGRAAFEGFNDLKTTHPDIARMLVNPEEATKVTQGSEKKVSWRCDVGHIWEAAVHEIVMPGKHCPYCSGSRILIGFNDLAATHKHFANQLVDPEPTTVTAGSKKIGLWQCSEGHRWKSKIGARVSNNVICPTCSGHRVLVGFNDLQTTNPELVPEADGWSPKAVTRGSAKKMRWKCQKGHIWRASVTSRVAKKSGCPTCSISGFDPNENGYLYFIEHLSWEMFQIGITNNPDERIANHIRLGWEVIEIRGPMDGHLTQQWETAILRMLKAKGADLSNSRIAGKFDGYSEAWSKSVFHVKSIKELMQLTEDFEESIKSHKR
jgi:hypothetical protein